MEDELLEGAPALRYDEQAQRRPARREDLLDRSPASDELLLRAEEVRRWQRGPATRPGIGSVGGTSPRTAFVDRWLRGPVGRSPAGSVGGWASAVWRPGTGTAAGLEGS
jgi:hypothetical protein